MNVLYRIKWAIFDFIPEILTQRAFEECHCWHIKGSRSLWCLVCSCC